MSIHGNGSLRRLIGRGAPFAFALLLFAIDWVVRATPNGPTRDMLSFGGTLTQNGKPLPGPQTLTFAFKKNGATVCSPSSQVNPDAVTGAFNAQVDTSACSGVTLFDGGDVAVDV